MLHRLVCVCVSICKYDMTLNAQGPDPYKGLLTDACSRLVVGFMAWNQSGQSPTGREASHLIKANLSSPTHENRKARRKGSCKFFTPKALANPEVIGQVKNLKGPQSLYAAAAASSSLSC